MKINHFGLLKKSKSNQDKSDSFFCQGISSIESSNSDEFKETSIYFNQSSNSNQFNSSLLPLLHQTQTQTQTNLGYQNGFYYDYYKDSNLKSNQSIEFYSPPNLKSKRLNSIEEELTFHYNEKRNGILFDKETMNLRNHQNRVEKVHQVEEDQRYERSDLRKIYGTEVIDYMRFGQDDLLDDAQHSRSDNHYYRAHDKYMRDELTSTHQFQHPSLNSYPYNQGSYY
ncbi:hypothetical protein DFH28DRAFT_1128239 [Melampsora americana]|nr:hypothetical protein DFH28DRAFT_1128239 [Melampsora americana]